MGNHMDRVLKGLLKRTEEGKLSWRAAVENDHFIAAVDTLGVSVRQLPAAGFSSSERYRLTVFNEEGVPAESLETRDKFGIVPAERQASDQQTSEMSRLFTLARRSALETDATLEKLANRLENF